MSKTKRRGSSLFDFIVESIDEALPLDSSIRGQEIYLRGFERYERYIFAQHLERQRQQLKATAPLLAQDP